MLQCVAVCCSVLQRWAVCCSACTICNSRLQLQDNLAFLVCTWPVHVWYEWVMSLPTYCNILQHNATHCNTLQHTATHCNCMTNWRSSYAWGESPSDTNESCPCNTLQHTVTHGNTRQHTATRCNTLQHTATHCNCRTNWRVYAWTESPSDTNESCLQRTATHCNILQLH